MFENIGLVQTNKIFRYFYKQPKKRHRIMIVLFIHQKGRIKLDLMLAWQFELPHDVV